MKTQPAPKQTASTTHRGVPAFHTTGFARRLLTAFVLLFACMPNIVWGQGLDLNAAPTPPLLDRFSYAHGLVEELEREILQRTGIERAETPVENLVIRTSRGLRHVAADLITLGMGGGDEGSVAIVMGVTLADARGDIDRALLDLVELFQRIDQTDANAQSPLREKFASVRRALRQFNDQVALNIGRIQTNDPAVLDHELAALLAPLGRALEMLSGCQLRSHWISTHQVQTIPHTLPVNNQTVAQRLPSVTELANRLSQTDVRDDTGAIIASVIAFLMRGKDFPELAPAVRQLCHAVDQVMDFSDAVSPVSWMDDTSKAKLADRLHDAVVGLQTVDDRQSALERIASLHRLASVTNHISQLFSSDADRRHVLRPLRGAFKQALGLADASAPNAGEQSSMLNAFETIVARMAAYRDLKQRQLRGPLRSVQLRLEGDYEQAERALVAALVEALPGGSMDMSNPAISSLVIEHQQYLTDLARLEKLPQWVDIIASIDASARDRFELQTRKMAAWLVDSNRRPDAVRAMQQFEHQVAMFYPLPFEQRMKADRELAARVTAGQQKEYLAVVHNTRAEWARAWSRGDAGSRAANTLLLLYRLMLIIEETEHLQALEDSDNVPLNRWAGWQLPPGLGSRAVRDLPNRITLAVVAAIEDDQDTLRRQVERVDRDAPLLRLAGRLSAVLAAPLDALNAGACGGVGQLTQGPGTDAWLVDRRSQLADICRYAAEREHARATDQRDIARDLRDYVSFQCDQLLTELGDRREPLPTLNGFDGSDPNPQDVEIKRK